MHTSAPGPVGRASSPTATVPTGSAPIPPDSVRLASTSQALPGAAPAVTPPGGSAPTTSSSSTPVGTAAGADRAQGERGGRRSRRRHAHLHLGLAALATAAALGLAGCAGSSAPGPRASADGLALWDVSRAEDISSVSALQRRSTLVAVVQIRSARPFVYGGVPFTTTTATVTRVLQGSSRPTNVRVRQFGDAANRAESLPAAMVPGKVYLAFLQPFELDPGQVTGEYVVVGAGLWEQQADGTFRMESALSRATGLPPTLDPSMLADDAAPGR